MSPRTKLTLAVGALTGGIAATLVMLRVRATDRSARRDRTRGTEDRMVDLAGEMSFPASDPPSWTSGRPT